MHWCYNLVIFLSGNIAVRCKIRIWESDFSATLPIISCRADMGNTRLDQVLLNLNQIKKYKESYMYPRFSVICTMVLLARICSKSSYCFGNSPFISYNIPNLVADLEGGGA